MTWLGRIALRPYGELTDLSVELGEGLTVVHGVNEAGKSTARDALVDFLCGIPTRSRRASSVPRARLAVEADVNHAGATTTWLRQAGGVETLTPGSPAVPPWNVGEPLDRNWWSTRYAIDHPLLREGGDAVLSAAKGTSDIGELIFVARRGEFAHRLADDLQKQCRDIYSSDRRRTTRMKVALKDLDEANGKLHDKLTRADDVVQQRSLLEQAERDLAAAQEGQTRARSALDLADAHVRIIGHVLAHAVAASELADLDAAGPRLSAQELGTFQRAVAGREAARTAAEKARREAAAVGEQVAELDVDEELLAAAAGIEELSGELQARLEGLAKVADHYAPEAERQEQSLRGLLTGLGVDVSGGVEEALDPVRVRTDAAATLDHLADGLEEAEARRDQHRERRREALRRLAGRGIVPDPEAGRTVPVAEARDVERAIRDSRAAAARADDALAGLREQSDDIRRALDVPRVEATVAREDVDRARGERDEVWRSIRADWVAEAHRPAAEREELAGRFEQLLAQSDDVGDREADERAFRSAADARAEVHDTRLRGLAEQIEQQGERLAEAQAAQAEAEVRWDSLWERAGITPAPAPDLLAVVVEDLAVVHGEAVDIRDAEERIRELLLPWAAAARDAGLPGSATPATWRARAQELDRIEAAGAELGRNRAAILDAEAKWASYRARALDVLDALDPEAARADEHEIAAAVRGLSARLSEHRGRQARAVTLAERLQTQHRAERAATDDERVQQLVIDGLAESHGVDEAQLGLMAGRAAQAADPLGRMEDAVAAIRAAWPAAVPQQVIDELRGSDEATVRAHRQRAEEAHDAAQGLTNDLAGTRGAEQERLRSLEARHGGEAALEQVRRAEAAVTELAGRWMRLRLQEELLGRVVASQSDDGVLPLLDDAGRILGRFTGGRWVALRPVAGHGARALQIVRSDGSTAGPDELSEGTLDQAFLALRLAAVRELHQQRRAAGRPDVPLILDDVLMAFDTDRTRAALEELADLAAGMQIVLFTHHTHVADLARGLDGVTVSDLPAPG